MTVTLNDILRAAVPSGVYPSRSRLRPETIQHATAAHGWRFGYLDGRMIHDKATFLDAVAEALAFPAHFGHNWDALADSLSDLSWAPAPGYLLLYDHVATFATAYPDEWEVAREISVEAANTWAENGVSFYVVLRGARLLS